MTIVAFDARPLQPQTRHWGPGVVLWNILRRLSHDFQLIGIAHRFQPPDRLSIRSWPVVPRLSLASFEVSPLLAGSFDVYWGANDYLPQLLRKPSVSTVHDLLPFNRMDSPRGLRAKLLKSRFVSSVRRADRIVTVSRRTADDLIAQFPELSGKIEVALNGFDAPSLAGIPDASARRREAPHLVMLGCHTPRKNLPLALAAVKQSNSDGARIPLCITGDIDPLFEPLIRANSPLVRRLGVLPKEEVFALLQGAVALLFPSLYEGFGFPLLEAMAAGCPVLALDTPINHEIAGNAAWLLGHDPKDWAGAIKTLMTSPDRSTELCEKGFENLKRFSWDKTARIYSEVFREVAR